MSDVLRTTGGIPRHQPQATMRGVHPRSPKGPGAFAYFRRSMAMNSTKTYTHKMTKAIRSTTTSRDTLLRPKAISESVTTQPTPRK